nr:MAG TPA: hypothetical protein [Myoviridae sp. ctiIS8]
MSDNLYRDLFPHFTGTKYPCFAQRHNVDLSTSNIFAVSLGVLYSSCRIGKLSSFCSAFHCKNASLRSSALITNYTFAPLLKISFIFII